MRTKSLIAFGSPFGRGFGSAIGGRGWKYRVIERIACVRRAIVDWIAPTGYEDETGFHYGTQPVADAPAPRRPLGHHGLDHPKAA